MDRGILIGWPYHARNTSNYENRRGAMQEAIIRSVFPLGENPLDFRILLRDVSYYTISSFLSFD